ncbi:hybrid sensor histidine kinase/response regulator [Labrys monachus]|uniref:histidine kinase n=1 Tax=Labrys monachus TaxID=217067 RepID=A0ABU0FN08_9HYPH|nr:PAS domain S-box protein [Labrys monachus]MDQ0395998.1 PAS domain S-box-containing protein [Labrys monachus]
MHAPASTDALAFLSHDGEMASLIATFDWSSTSIGPPAGWPAPLKSFVSFMLFARTPMVLLWGRDGVMIYNDAYARFAGGRHPASLGSKVLEAWPELADFNRNVLDVVLAGGTLAYRDQHLVLHRDGKPEDAWLNIDYTPVLDEQCVPAGVLTLIKDTTQRIWVEQRLRIAQEAGGVGTFEWFPESGLLEVSDQYRRIWGLDPDVVVTDDLLLDLMHPDDREAAGPSRLHHANPLDYSEYRRICPQTGEIRWIARRGEVVSSPEAGTRRFVGIVLDITERKRAEAAVIASEARWRGLFEQMHEGFFIGEAIRDANGRMVDFRFVELNPAFEQQTGLPAAEVNGRSVREMVPGIGDALIETCAGVVDGGQSIQLEIEIPALNGRWFEARARPAGPGRFAAMFVDISARIAAEQVIRESESRFRLMAQSMPNHVWTARADGSIDWFNDRVYAYAGLTEGTLDDNWAAMVHPEDAPRALQAWTRALEAGMLYETEFRLRRHDGSYRWHIARAVPIRGARGAVERWIGTNTEIEDQKTAEAALADLATTLEQRVEARTAELVRTQDALRQSQKMEAIGNLTGGVAHDFNNLLQVVSGNLQLLEKDIAENAKARRRVQNAMEGVSRGSKLASQLLAFGRRQPLAPKVVNLGRLLRGMDDLLRRTLGEAIEVETVIAGGLWNTLIDPANVENALLNLAINARDAMDGRGKLTIEAGNAFLDLSYAAEHPDVTSGQYVLLAVTDTGCGMSPDIVEKVFEPFFSTKVEGKGSGLGLSMVYGFVKQSGGHIKIYSEIGHGTTVRLYLPRSIQSEDTLVDLEPGPVIGGSETILVAEDDASVRETAVALLSDLGYRVLKAKDAQSALSIIESGMPIDLLFTDVVMPGPLKSTELARKARERLPHLSVLFTSGYTENAIVHAGRLDEGVELLSKPYTRESLAHRLRHVFANDRGKGRAGGRRLRILVCAGDAQTRRVMAGMLGELGHQVLEASDGRTALAMRDVDVLLCETQLPDMAGLLLVERARAREAALPVILAADRAAEAKLAADPAAAAPMTAVIPQSCTKSELAAALAAVTAGR